jgi:hypothetical protein
VGLVLGERSTPAAEVAKRPAARQDREVLTSSRSAPGQSSPLRRAIVAGLVVLGLGAFAFAFTLGGDQGSPSATDAAIENRMPAPDSQVLSQSTIEVDLAPGWTGVLQVNGLEIPADQLNCVDDCGRPLCVPGGPAPAVTTPGCRPADDPQNRVFFVPGEGKVIEELSAGPVVVTATFWPITETRESSRTASWAFRVSA